MPRWTFEPPARPSEERERHEHEDTNPRGVEPRRDAARRRRVRHAQRQQPQRAGLAAPLVGPGDGAVDRGGGVADLVQHHPGDGSRWLADRDGAQPRRVVEQLADPDLHRLHHRSGTHLRHVRDDHRHVPADRVAERPHGGGPCPDRGLLVWLLLRPVLGQRRAEGHPGDQAGHNGLGDDEDGGDHGRTGAGPHPERHRAQLRQGLHRRLQHGPHDAPVLHPGAAPRRRARQVR